MSKYGRVENLRLVRHIGNIYSLYLLLLHARGSSDWLVTSFAVGEIHVFQISGTFVIVCDWK